MSVLAVENPVLTVLRLLESRIRVVKDNAAVASIKCTEENYDRELLKDYDAQITMAIDPALGVQDQRLNLTGSLRRRVFFLKCTTFSMNKETSGSDQGKAMREKINAQINAIIRENRTLPYQTTYNFYGLGYPEGTPHKAYDAVSASELAPSSTSWAELSVLNYAKIWSNDDVFHSKATSTNGQYAEMLFRFKIGLKAGETRNEPREQCVKNIVLTFVGYGIAALGNGATIKVWNHTTSAWTNTQAGTGSAKETLTITLTSSLINYIDADGYLWLLARTTNTSNGTAITLYCDFVQCVIQVQGVTKCDVVRYKNADVVSVKPFLFTSEFTLRAWLIENIT